MLQKRHDRVPVSQLQFFEGNSRRGDIAGIRESLDENDQFRSILVNEGTLTGRPWEVLCGNNTLAASIEKGETEIDVEIIDVDQRAALKINLAENKYNDRATYDTDALLEQLSILDGDYDGSGWTEDEVAKMLNPPMPDDEPDPAAGMGDFEYRITVDCDNEDHQTRLLREFEREGLSARPLIV